jgi:hypothetical protein
VVKVFGWQVEVYKEPPFDCTECGGRAHPIFDVSGFTFNIKPRKVKNRSSWLLEFEHNRRHEIGFYLKLTLFRQKAVFRVSKILRTYTKEELLK